MSNCSFLRTFALRIKQKMPKDNIHTMSPHVIAGPCSAESLDMCLQTASRLKTAGVSIFRAGLWKPRTQPDSFEGVGETGLAWLKAVKDTMDMLVATEVATAEHVRLCAEHGIDIVWIGARTTTNPFMVQQIADALSELPTDKQPCVMIKNPINPDLNLWIGAINRIKRAGIKDIIAIHRGFSTNNTYTLYGHEDMPLRNQPLWSIPIALKQEMPDISIICDPSHMTGHTELVAVVAKQALAMNMDGLIIEVHPTPTSALSDKEQQLSIEQFEKLLPELRIQQTSNIQNELSKYREQIDEIDNSLWQLIAQRHQIAALIGKCKKQNKMPVFQEQRYLQLLQSRIRQATAQGITPQAAEAIINALHEDAISAQI